MILDLFDLPILHYITVRAALAAVTAFLLGLAAGPRVIGFLRARKIADLPKGEAQKLDQINVSKKGTPTMGGVLIVGATLVATLAFARLDAFFVELGLFSMLSLAGLGFIDDYRKLFTKGKGLSSRAKLRLQVAIGLVVGLAIYAHYLSTDNRAEAQSFAVGEDEQAVLAVQHFVHGTALYVPFVKAASFPLGIGYVVFAALVLVATCNAVNFTDGLDGLAAGTSLSTIGAFVTIAYVSGRVDWTTHLLLPFVPGAGEAVVFGAAAMGALLAFLWWNAYPAQVFMGDTGSLALGGVIATLALAVKQELLLPIAGGIFVLEGSSVVLQVAGFKLTGKRIFRCAPIHHHFQYAGDHEVKVTTRFWLVGVILALVSIATLKVR